MKRSLGLAAACGAALTLAGCAVYETAPPPPAYPAYPSYPAYAPYPAYGYYGGPAYSFSFGWSNHGHHHRRWH